MKEWSYLFYYGESTLVAVWLSQTTEALRKQANTLQEGVTVRIADQNGKKYRAYSPEEFFKSPESPQQYFIPTAPKPKKVDVVKIEDKTDQEPA
ncbi:MAG: hypothetical protein KGZ93_11250 [Actinobacteria bacterium]|nr:hypothetical protein [Actinomycetota bacterium]